MGHGDGGAQCHLHGGREFLCPGSLACLCYLYGSGYNVHLLNIQFLAVNCTAPPTKPSAGTWEWNGDQAFGASVTYTCGPYGSFRKPSGELYEELISSCVWNKTWSPPELDICAATFCQEIPFPPKSIGLEYAPDAKNNITLASGGYTWLKYHSRYYLFARILCIQPHPADDHEVSWSRFLRG